MPSDVDNDRRALAAVAGQFFVNGAMTASFVSRAPQIRNRLGVDIDQFGVLLTCAAVFGLVGSAFAGRIIHRGGTKQVLRTGAVVMVLTLPVMGFARTPWVWLVGMLFYAFLDVLVDISMNLQGSWISARRHMPVMNRLHGVWSLGTFVGGLGGVAANAAHMSPSTQLSIVAVLMAGALAFVTRSLLPDDSGAHEDEPAGPRDTGRIRYAPVVLLMVGGMFAVLMEVTGGDWASFRMTDDFHAAAAIGSLAFVAFTIGMTSMRFAGDWLQHRFGHLVLHRMSVAIATVGFALATLVRIEAVPVVGFFLVGLGVATFMPKLYDDAARQPGRRGAALGAMTGGMRVAYLLTPIAVGGLAGTSLSVGAAIAIVTLPAAVGLAVVTESNSRLMRKTA